MTKVTRKSLRIMAAEVVKGRNQALPSESRKQGSGQPTVISDGWGRCLW